VGAADRHPCSLLVTPWIREAARGLSRSRLRWSISPAGASTSSTSSCGRRTSHIITGLMIAGALALFLVTALFGRLWCGYTCPQTVWTDLFLVVERGIEGDRNARIKLDGAPWSFDKLGKRIAKHAIWLVIAVATGGAWIFYFADAPTLLGTFVTGQADPVAYITVAILTATTYAFGGLMREQVCTYMCPWPRIQAAMLDENSLTVTYNDWRGEPRSRHAKKGQRLRGFRSAIASTATLALRSARWASTFATASSSNASPARCASTPATASWTRSARPTGLTPTTPTPPSPARLREQGDLQARALADRLLRPGPGGGWWPDPVVAGQPAQGRPPRHPRPQPDLRADARWGGA
jgi:hypothetical protein